MSLRSRFAERQTWLRILSIAGIAAFAGLMVGSLGLPVRNAGRSLQDRLQPAGDVDDRLVIVSVDERTHAELGWLPGRSGVERGLGGMAELLTRIESYEPALVVLDPWSRSALQGFEAGVPILGEALATTGPVTLVVEPGRFAAPLQAAEAIGKRGLIRDEDSVVRFIGLLEENNPQQEAIQPFAVLAAAVLADDLPAAISTDERELQIGSRRIPVEWAGPAGANRTALTRIRFHNDLVPGGARVISAADVLAGRVEPDALRGKVVVTGMTMPRDIDLVPTPTGTTEIGDETVPAIAPTFIVANALNTLLTGQFIVPASDTATIVTTVLVALLVSTLCFRGPLWSAPLIGVAAIGGWLLVASFAFTEGRLVTVIQPISAVVVACAAAVTARGALELQARRRLHLLFATYVPAAVARQLVDSGRAGVAASGERLLVTILFCDLRGFTPLAEQLAPSDLRRLLEHFYEHISRIIFEHGGTVLQYTGDEVFAVFGAPLATSDHSVAAVRSVVDILDAAPALNATLRADDLPPVEYGIGINTGEVVAAHIGSVQRKQYSIMGDPVNVCSRLCSRARAGQALIAETTLDKVDTAQRPTAASVVELALQGVKWPVVAYLVTSGSETANGLAKDPPTPR